VLAVSGAWALAAPASEGARFAQGVEAYDHGRYREAADHFAWITERVPRAADAWANLGTAAWAAGDTARAALGWEQALRLQPMARDARERLDRVLPTTGVGPGAVPPVPASVVALVAAALWIGGWLFAAERLLRRRRGAAIALGLVGAGVLFGVAAAQLDARLSTRGLGIVSANTSLHLLPLLGAEATGTVRIGEVTRVLEHRGVWTHVNATDVRDGWIPSTALLPLGRD